MMSGIKIADDFRNRLSADVDKVLSGSHAKREDMMVVGAAISSAIFSVWCDLQIAFAYARTVNPTPEEIQAFMLNQSSFMIGMSVKNLDLENDSEEIH